MGGAPLLSVATFGRVFDVHPAVDALTLEELTEALSRFQLKTELARRERRDLERARQAQRAHLAGEAASGPMSKRLARHLGRHRDANAAELALADLEKDIRREAKQDLRLWAPTLFTPGERREDGNVVHLSALVFDFDRGPGPAELRAIFADVFHLAHSTWSHTPGRPKLRLVIPFSAPVAASDYVAVWHYADERTGRRADPTGRALARAWALPAVPSPDRERMAWTHPGPLFDPFALGLAPEPEPTPVPQPTRSSFLRRDPGETYLPPNAEPVIAVEPAGAFDPWDGGAIVDSPSPTPSQAPAPAPSQAPPSYRSDPKGSPRHPAADHGRPPGPAATRGSDLPAEPPEPSLVGRVQALEARVAALEKLLADYLD